MCAAHVRYSGKADIGRGSSRHPVQRFRDDDVTEAVQLALASLTQAPTAA
ncbi:MAG: hypothetical protein WCB22_20570 [Pseudolabrys sp.]